MWICTKNLEIEIELEEHRGNNVYGVYFLFELRCSSITLTIQFV